MGRRNDHSREEIRELAIQATLEIVAQQGMKALSARKIAAAIGYTPGSLYLVFKNLDELILHANLRNLELLRTSVTNASQHCTEPHECLLSLGRAYLQFATEQSHAWRMIFEHSYAEEMLLPEWYEAAVQALFALLEKPLAALMKTTDKVAVRNAGHVLWSGVHGICVLHLSGKLQLVRGIPPQILLQQLMETYLVGLRQQGLDAAATSSACE